MNWLNSPQSWFELERALSGRPGHGSPVPYAELHAHSNFSFLDGASHPEELAAEAARLDLEALALTDHEACTGSCGSPRQRPNTGSTRSSAPS